VIEMRLFRSFFVASAALVLAWSALPAEAKLTTDDVIKMHKAGLPESVIVSTIKASDSAFDLSAADIINLHKAGVPAKVIEALMATKKSAPATPAETKAPPPKSDVRPTPPPPPTRADPRRDEDDDRARPRKRDRREEEDDDDRRPTGRAPTRAEREAKERREREARERDERRRREDAERQAEDRKRREEKERHAEERRRREEQDRLADERRIKEEREAEDRKRAKRAESQRLAEKLSVFSQGKDLEAAKRYFEAAGFYYEFMTRLASPGAQEYHDAEYYLARALHDGGLAQAAIPYFSNVVRRGPKDPNFRRAFRRLRVLQEQLLVPIPDLMEKLAETSVQDYPEDFRDEFNYTIGKFYNRVGNFSRATRFLDNVSERSDFFSSAAYLRALILMREKKAKSAHELFKKAVLAAEKSPGSKGVDRGVLELGYLALARLAYEVGGHEAAIFYYNKIPQSSTKIGQALFEKGWVHFQAGNHPLALGTFHGMHSPYFADRFHPDLYILEATIYLNMCHFTLAKELVERYQKVYGKLHKDLKTLLAQGTPPQELFKMFLATGEGRPSGGGMLPKQLYSYVLQDAEFADLVAALKLYDSQARVLSGLIRSRAKGERLWNDAAAEIEVRRERLNRQAGSMIRQKLQKAEQEMGEFLIKADEITFETINAEKDQLDKEAAALMTGATIKEGKLKERQKLKFDWAYEYWEDEGEVWADEVDSYRSLLGDGCKQ
jgi:hypothetical protein